MDVQDAGPQRIRLDSWKQIAAFFGRTVITVQRWEAREGLPVHRHAHAKRGTVFAYTDELEAWQLTRTQRPSGPNLGVSPEGDFQSKVTLPLFQRGIAAGAAVIRPKWTAAIALIACSVLVVGLTWSRARPTGPVPDAPTHLVASSPERATVILRWRDRSSFETRFEVSRFGNVVERAPVNATSIVLGGLDPGTSYHWSVRACNANGCSPWHEVVGQTPDGSDAPTETPSPPSVGGDNDMLFVSDRGSGQTEIYVMHADGSNPTRITRMSGGLQSPVWSPDRTRIAFASIKVGSNGIHVMNADGAHDTNLTGPGHAEDLRPAWSPDGRRIAFGSTRSGNFDIWVMAADGSHLIKLTDNLGIDGGPDWSPDGRRIAFDSNRNGNYDIYVMGADGSSPLRLTTDTSIDTSPVWSPDGSRLAFRSNRDGNAEVYVMDADGSHQHNVTGHKAQDIPTAWSPDGSRIAFVTDRDGDYEIYTIAPDGSNLVNLTNSIGADTAARWGLAPSGAARPQPHLAAGKNGPRPRTR